MNRKTQTILRTILLVVALANQMLSACGLSPLPIKDGDIEMLVTTGATVIAAMWAWWKNNSLTKPAQQADNYLDAIKTAEKERP